MPEMLQLRNFDLIKLHVDWTPLDGREYIEDHFQGVTSFDYEVLRRNDAPTIFALKLEYGLKPKSGKAGYAIEAEIVGFFEFAESTEEDKMQYLIRVNGGTILYGILRGEVAAFTGSFPGGKFVMPSVYMQEVVAQVEADKKAERAKTKATTKSRTKTKRKNASSRRRAG